MSLMASSVAERLLKGSGVFGSALMAVSATGCRSLAGMFRVLESKPQPKTPLYFPGTWSVPLSTARPGGEDSGNFDKSEQRTADITKTSCLAEPVNCVIIPATIFQHSRNAYLAIYLEDDHIKAIFSTQNITAGLDPIVTALIPQHAAVSNGTPVIRFIFSHATACQTTKPPLPPQPCRPLNLPILPTYFPKPPNHTCLWTAQTGTKALSKPRPFFPQ
ncbi:hypothetical protein QBC41DRAFT_67601 [Cercophora samala]|uniref:Uncharacterized protein n=1 Tax=Cercophora samala TaxID=330535 RepID=A0AA39ZGQ0_9PEZI|nr:hypothetical protein QBC41DRAFT_67601 [Cercophora samala]